MAVFGEVGADPWLLDVVVVELLLAAVCATLRSSEGELSSTGGDDV